MVEIEAGDRGTRTILNNLLDDCCRFGCPRPVFHDSGCTETAGAASPAISGHASVDRGIDA